MEEEKLALAGGDGEEPQALHRRRGWVGEAWEESKKLWGIVGPAIFLRLTSYSMTVITQAFAGHLGNLELASITMGSTVISGFNLGLLLGMASALETLCGQAYGAKKYHMLGVFLQRSWIVLFVCAVLLLPIFFFAAPFLELIGESAELAHMSGLVCLWSIPQHFAFAFVFPLNRFLQCQLKNSVTAVTSGFVLAVHIVISWLFVGKLQVGLMGAVFTLDFTWWLLVLCQYIYVTCGWCPETWHGFSTEAFLDLWEFVKLSAASGVMICLENWYYRILLLLTGMLKNAEVAVDALSICMNINGWEMMIPLAFFAGTGVRVANELGAGNGKGAKYATIVAATTSGIIGILFFCIIVFWHEEVSLIFTSSWAVIEAVNDLYLLLAFTILLNSIQPILSGVAVGAGWQSKVAYVNVGTYYIIGLPLGIIMGWFLHLGVLGIWGGMIGGTVVQTAILVYITAQCDWNNEARQATARMQRHADSTSLIEDSDQDKI